MGFGGNQHDVVGTSVFFSIVQIPLFSYSWDKVAMAVLRKRDLW